MIVIDSLEQRLTDAYRMQANLYEDAICIVNSDAQSIDMDDWVNDLRSTLHEVAVIEARIAHDKVSWEESGRTPGNDLQGILKRIAVQIRSLTTLIDRRSEELMAKKQRLLPVLDEFIRQRHMLQSYGQFGRSK